MRPAIWGLIGLLALTPMATLADTMYLTDSLPLSWIAAAIGVCLIAGFLLGMWWADYRSRQRHGGIRIY